MSYTLLAVLGVVLAALLDLFVLRTRLLRTKVFWASYAVIVFFQLITNGVLTGIPVVRYDPNRILGLRIAFAPVEDLLFGFALIFWPALGSSIRMSRWLTPLPSRTDNRPLIPRSRSSQELSQAPP